MLKTTKNMYVYDLLAFINQDGVFIITGEIPKGLSEGTNFLLLGFLIW